MTRAQQKKSHWNQDQDPYQRTRYVAFCFLIVMAGYGVATDPDPAQVGMAVVACGLLRPRWVPHLAASLADDFKNRSPEGRGG